MAFKEKRKESRYYVNMICEVGDNLDQMHVIDVSMNGIGIMGKNILVVGSPLDINVKLEDKILRVRGVIMDMVKMGSNYRYGLEIVSDKEDWWHIVYEYVAKNK